MSSLSKHRSSGIAPWVSPSPSRWIRSSTINIDADSTFALALEAQARGHALYHYLPQALTLRDGRLYARGRPLEVRARARQPSQLRRRRGARPRRASMSILMRQDPPFDMAYITATHLLELLPADGPLVVNDPAAVRNAPEKLFVTALQGADAADPAHLRPRRDPRLPATSTATSS